MYCINEKQIDFILNDIRARGVEMESLRNDLLDHICCIIEQNLKEEEDFENFYANTITGFYKDELWEIEEETLRLLTFKNYYAMKKTMITSGVASTISLGLGLIFKFMHWPGAGFLILLGIALAGLLFLPLVFTLKAKEKQKAQERITLLIGGLATSVLSFSILFKIFHWPYANVMGMAALLTLTFVFLPVYFFNGVRNPETKVNTITSSILIFLGCGLVFALIRSPKGSQKYYHYLTQGFIYQEDLVNNERKWLKENNLMPDSTNLSRIQLCEDIYVKCSELKSALLKIETGYSAVNDEFKSKAVAIEEHAIADQVDPSTVSGQLIANIKNLVEEYNARFAGNGGQLIPTRQTVFDTQTEGESYLTTFSVLNQITQLQLFALQHQKAVLATK